MTATPPRYRTLDRPSPGLAMIAEPDGRVALWALSLRGRRFRPCVQCGQVSSRTYHSVPGKGPIADPRRLCRPCVEGVAET